MHISEGVLSFPVITAGYALTTVTVGMSLWQLKDKDIVRTAVFSATFFVAALIHIPLGPGNVHLILNGLIGLLLGPACFCAIFIALAFQAVLFQFGGLTSLGVNTLNMALPAYVCYLIFSPALRKHILPEPLIGFCVGFLSVFLSGLLLSVFLVLSGDHFWNSAKLIFLAHIPVMVMDGLIAAMVLQFFKKVKPEMIWN